MKIICVGQNYRAHRDEMGGAEMKEPTLFGKFEQTMIGDGDPIVLPRDSTHIDAEAELAVVIGKTIRRVSREKALDAVRGYVCANDVSARVTSNTPTRSGFAARTSRRFVRSARRIPCR